jgi:DNA-binding transcriptional regulator YiaG
MKTSELSYLKTEGKNITDDEAKIVAETLLNSNITMKGEEVAFIRKSLKLSYDKIGKLLGVSPSTVLRWEQKPDQVLSSPNALAVRSVCSGKLGIQLVTQDQSQLKTPKALVLDKTKKNTSVQF